MTQQTLSASPPFVGSPDNSSVRMLAEIAAELEETESSKQWSQQEEDVPHNVVLATRDERDEVDGEAMSKEEEMHHDEATSDHAEQYKQGANKRHTPARGLPNGKGGSSRSQVSAW